MRVTTEAAEKELHLLMHHRVVGHGAHKCLLFSRVRQFAVQQQIARFQEIAIDCQLLDWVTAIQQFALVTINVGDRRVTGCSRHETRIVGELACGAIELADVDNVRADCALVDRQFE